MTTKKVRNEAEPDHVFLLRLFLLLAHAHADAKICQWLTPPGALRRWPGHEDAEREEWKSDKNDDDNNDSNEPVPDESHWIFGPRLNHGRAGPGAVALSDGVVFCCGGMEPPDGPSTVDTTEILRPTAAGRDSAAWSLLSASLAESRVFPTCEVTSCAGSSVLVAGGIKNFEVCRV